MSNEKTYTLKLSNKTVQKAIYIFLLLFIIAICIMDIPMTGYTFPGQIVWAARIIAVSSILMAFLLIPVFLYYRSKKQIYLNEQGIQFPHYPFILWKSIQWYKIHIISNHGLNGMKLKTDYGKVVITAEDDEALYHFKEDFKENIARYNPAAKEFRELRSSKVKAVIISVILIAIYLTACMLMDFEKRFVWIFLPVLLITMVALWTEHIQISK